jgi:monoterpene epsilon-lactone hydrolase
VAVAPTATHTSLEPPRLKRRPQAPPSRVIIKTEQQMPSVRMRAVNQIIRALIRRRSWGDPQALTRRARRLFGAPPMYGRLIAAGLEVRAQRSKDVNGEWLVPRGSTPGVVLYVHGGGFVSCSAATHRPIAAALARHSRRSVFSVDYRLAPDAPLASAHEDVRVAYEWLLQSGMPPAAIALAGDSAGGNLVLALAIQLREARRPMPACVVGFSPWLDLAGASDSVRRNDGHCVMFHAENIRDFASVALRGDAADSPLVSPAYAELHGLPPVLLHVGSTELLLDDSRRACERMRSAGGDCELRVYDDVPHCWQMLAPLVPEANASLRSAAAFIERAFAASASTQPGA